MDWKDAAACRGMDNDAFMVEDPSCLQICRTCKVILDCLKYALATDSQGVWGGTTTEQRLDLRQRQSLLNGEIVVVWEILND